MKRNLKREKTKKVVVKRPGLSNCQKLHIKNKILYLIFGFFIFLVFIVVMDIVYQNNNLDRSILNTIVKTFSTIVSFWMFHVIKNK